jgi:hypothetical protein
LGPEAALRWSKLRAKGGELTPQTFAVDLVVFNRVDLLAHGLFPVLILRRRGLITGSASVRQRGGGR